MNEITKLFLTRPEPASFARGYLEYLGRVLAQIDLESIGGFIRVLIDARERGARIVFIGNGGSAATASHFANDLAIGTRAWSKPFMATSLTDNVAVMTAIANDYGYEELFTIQLKTCLKPGDVLVGISVSGNSPNVVRAFELANEIGAVTVSLTGFDGGRLRAISRHNVHVPTNPGEYGPAEDAHMILDHLVGGFLMNLCHSETTAAAGRSS